MSDWNDCFAMTIEEFRAEEKRLQRKKQRKRCLGYFLGLAMTAAIIGPCVPDADVWIAKLIPNFRRVTPANPWPGENPGGWIWGATEG